MRSSIMCLLLVLVASHAHADSVRPNILVLIADDLGWADVGWHGSEIKTPHLDRLAADGVILDQHYVTPMCSSTRACLLSGRYSTRFGLDGATNARVIPFGMTTLASGLQSLGYDTGLTGKWHLGSMPDWGPARFGFSRSYGSFAGGVDQYSHLYKRGQFQKTWHRNHRYVEEEGHATDLIAGEAIGWIKSAPERGQPWFIQVAFTAVHVPIQEPEQWVEPYADEIENESRRRYAGCATHMDHTIGEMITALEETDQLEDTLIIFTSDNGGSGPWKPTGLYPGQYDPCPVLGNNAPLRGGKGTVFEGGIRVPAFVHWHKTLPAGKRVSDPVHIVDWMPTLFRLTGCESTEQDFKFDGRDIWPLINGEPSGTRTLYFSRGKSAALRHGPWKLIVKGTDRQLFNLDSDPSEQTDLTDRRPAKLQELSALLRAEQAKEKGAKLTQPKP